jgi:lipopolysaccharide assembly outer membrane protein LptD (OstA)
LRRAFVHVVALLAASLLGSAAVAQQPNEALNISADEVEYQTDRDIYVGRGHVVINQQGKTLTADHVMFSNKTRQGVATGNVVVKDGTDVLRSPFLQFNIDTVEGVVYDGELDSAGGGYRMQGREVRKTGPNSYAFDDARFTTCRCPKDTDRDPWAVRAKKADLDLDGYGHARNSTLEVLGIPVFWLPYAVYPLKRARQTGFLFPQGGTSSQSGGNINLPFFWAARDDLNVTLEADYQFKRGFKPSADLEYVFGERGYSKLYGTYIHDNSIDTGSPTSTFGDNRWGATFKHMQDLPAGSWMAANVAAVSDNQFPFDFSDFRAYRRDRFLQSTGLIGSSFLGPSERIAATIAAQSTDDIQNPDDQDRDNVLLQRLPKLALAAMPASAPILPGLVTSGDLEFVNYQAYGDPADEFARSYRVNDQFYDTGFDGIPNGQERNSNGIKVPTDAHRDDNIPGVQAGPENDGRFEEGEPLADHGQRVIARPRISYPFQLGNVVELVPEAGYYGTFYNANLGGGAQRSLFTGRVDLRAKVRGSLSLPFGMGNATHTAEPFLSWVGISQTGQNGNPLFVPQTAVPQARLRLLELDNLTLDPSDRIPELSNVVVGVNNRFWGDAAGNLLGELTISSQYQMADGRWGPAVAQGQATLPKGFAVRVHAAVDLDPASFSDGLVDFGWSRWGHQLSLRYRYVRDIPQVFENFERNDRFEDFTDDFTRINQISGVARWQATEHWAATYAGAFSFDNSLSLVNQFGIEYLSQCNCWAVRLEVDEDRTRGFEWTLRYRLVGLGDQKQQLFTR